MTSQLPPLTDVQRRIVWGIANGATRDDLAEELGINAYSVRDHEVKLRRRLGVADRVDLPAAVEAAYGPLYDPAPAA
jgi:DNA-binding CsgD family transcriptional regulator